ncbi:MAG: hypothetical protein V1904_15005 [Bacteroidota bacterium]
MKRLFFSLILILFCTLLFEQCKKGRCLGTIEFTEEALDIIPYKGYETLIFTDSLGDTMKYFITSRFSNYNRLYEDGVNGQYNIDKYDYYLVEQNHIASQPNNISFQMDFATPIMILQYWINVQNDTEIFGGGGRCGFSEGNLYEISNGSNLTKYDSVSIINKKYFSVYKLDYTNMQLPSDSAEYMSTTYYSINEGIVGFSTNMGRSWCLQ